MTVIYILITITGILATIWLCVFGYAWHHNAVYGTKYEIQQLIAVGTLIASQITALIVNHSLLNTNIQWLSDLFAHRANNTQVNVNPGPESKEAK